MTKYVQALSKAILKILSCMYSTIDRCVMVGSVTV